MYKVMYREAGAPKGSHWTVVEENIKDYKTACFRLPYHLFRLPSYAEHDWKIKRTNGT